MDKPVTERRKVARRRVLKGGKISFHQLGTSTDCAVRNLSDAGACLLVTSQVGIPNEFELSIESEHTVRLCRIEWRSGSRIGVSFR